MFSSLPKYDRMYDRHRRANNLQKFCIEEFVIMKLVLCKTKKTL